MIEVLVKPGDTIKVEQSLITVESDKASMEIPSSAAGVLKELKVKVGDKVNIGDLVARAGRRRRRAAAARRSAGSRAGCAAAARRRASRSAARRRPARAPAAAPAAARTRRRPTGSLPHASPSVRKFARELGVPLDEVKGTRPQGPHHAGRRAGLHQGGDERRRPAPRPRAPRRRPAAAAARRSACCRGPRSTSPSSAPVERKDLSRIKKISGANLHRNWVMIPHVTNHDDADITELEAFRVSTNKENEKSGVKVTMLAFLIKAVRRGAEEIPRVQHLARRRPAGLQAVLPHRLRGRHAQRPGGAGAQGRRQEGRPADQPGDGRAGQEGARRQARPGRHAGRAASRSPRSAASAARYFTPIINAPEVAILGVSQEPDEAGVGRQGRSSRG